MRKFIYTILLAASLVFCVSGCHYLDVDPEIELTEETVFSTYANAMSFFDTVYDAYSGKNKSTITLCYPLYIDLLNDFYAAWVSTTDAADAGKLWYAQRNFKACNMSQDCLTQFTFATQQADKPIGTAMFACIRIANMTIAHFPELTNGTEQERNDLLGQAYFVRGLCHFTLCRYFGGMPYIDYVIGAEDEWDIKRLSSYETYVKAAEDLETAADYLAKAGYYRRNTPDILVPSARALRDPSVVMCKAVRARALLYAASPLNNVSNDVKAWENAAEACAEALKIAEEWGYDLTPFESIRDNYYGPQITNETFWVYNLSSKNNVQNFSGWLSYCQSKLGGIKGSSGVHPTQNFVDRFETADGYLLRTEAERARAIAAGSYRDQDPYSNRDPRFDVVILHDGSLAFDKAVVSEGCFNIYYDPEKKTYPHTTLNSTAMYYAADWGSGDNNTQGISNTGYYCKRYWNGTFDVSYYRSDPMFRLGELYLSYAEAVNEAYGPTASAKGHSLTAAEAVNIVRARSGMPTIEESMAKNGQSMNKSDFRDRVQNERCIELAYESNHYYFDIRRWKIAPQTMGQTLYGMYVEKCTPSAEHPNGRIYTRRAIPSNRQSKWKDCMYVLPFPDAQANTMKNFENNEKWQ